MSNKPKFLKKNNSGYSFANDGLYRYSRLQPKSIMVGKQDWQGREIISQSNYWMVDHYHYVFYVVDDLGTKPFSIEKWFNEDGTENPCWKIFVFNSNHQFYKQYLASGESAKKMAMNILSALALSYGATLRHTSELGYDEK